MRLHNRIDRLERRIGVSGGCRVCGGRGPQGIEFIMAGSPLASSEPRTCAGCGRQGEDVFYIETFYPANGTRYVVGAGEQS